MATRQVGDVIPGGKNRLGSVTSHLLPPGDVAAEARALGHATREAASTSLSQVFFSAVSHVREPTSRAKMEHRKRMGYGRTTISNG